MKYSEIIEWHSVETESVPECINLLFRTSFGEIHIGFKDDCDKKIYFRDGLTTDEIYNVDFFAYLPKGPPFKRQVITNDACIPYLLKHAKDLDEAG